MGKADSRGAAPYLIIAAFWSDDDVTDRVAKAIRRRDFPSPPGYHRGAVVAFRYEIADSCSFRHDLGRFNLSELNRRPDDT